MIEFYHFSYGEQVFRYTSSSNRVLWAAQQWEPEKLARGAIKLDAKLEAGEVTVDVAAGNEVARLFLTGAPRESVGLTIYRGDETDLAGTTEPIWMGEVAKVRFSGASWSMTCVPVITLGRGQLPIGRYSVGCRWALYSDACGVDRATYSETCTIQAIDQANRLVTLRNSEWVLNQYMNGLYQDLTGFYLIVDRESSSDNGDGTWDTTFKLESWPPNAAVGGTAVISYGCDHTHVTCNHTFNNAYNYGGFTSIPRS